MRRASVLYDVPGPRARRITVAVSVAAGLLVVAGGYALVYRPLAAHGQFSVAKWSPLLDPTDPRFQLLWTRLGDGLRNTVLAALGAIIASLLVGTALAVLRVQLQALRRRRFVGVPAAAALALRGTSWALGVVTRFCVEVFRGLPVVITIFFVGRGLPELGLDIDTVWYLIIGLTVYNGVVIAEILRSGMAGLPGGQREAAAALGLSPLQTTRLVLLPQAFRIMLPALISQVVVVFKDTSLGFIIGYEDLLQVANQAINVLNNPLQLYAVVGVIFILVNSVLSRLAVIAQRRLARARRAPGGIQAPPSAAAVTAEAAVG